MGFFLVMKAEVVRTLIIMRRYWFATIIGILVGYGFLMMLISAFMTNSGRFKELTDEALSSVLGFIVGMFAFGIVGLFSQGLQGMARTGQLEQVCTSPHGLVTNFLARSFVSAVTSIFSLSIVLFLVTVTLKGKITATPGPTVALLFLTYCNLIGFGFMVGGLVLVFKQVGQIAMLLRMGLFALAIIAGKEIVNWPSLLRWIAHALPITDASICLKLVLIDGLGYRVFVQPSFLFLIINCALWTVIGISLFKLMENWSRAKGTLGAY